MQQSKDRYMNYIEACELSPAASESVNRELCAICVGKLGEVEQFQFTDPVNE